MFQVIWVKFLLAVATDGIEEIKKFKISLFNPIRPMLADRVKSETEAIKKMPPLFAAEYKIGWRACANS